MEDISMKEKNSTTIKTIPDGVWESSHDSKPADNKDHKNDISTDLQGNGYPAKNHHDR